MPTKTRSATINTTDDTVTDAPERSGSASKGVAANRAAGDSLTAPASEAKHKSPPVSPSVSDPTGARMDVHDASRDSEAALAGEDATTKTGKAIDPQRIDPAASRKAAAAFVAARRKMAPAAPPAPPLTSSDSLKGTVQVSDKKVRRTTLEDVAPVAEAAPMPEAPVAAAPAPAPVMPQRPFSTIQRGGPAAMKARPAPSAKGQVFKTGEFIVYPAHGVGQITAVESQEVAGYKLELFVISFVKDKMILKVPLPKISSVGMRKLAEPPVMKRALDTLTGRARVKRTMWSRRAQEYEAKINSGDLIAIAEVVRDLYRSDAQPEQSYSERQLYEAALDRMAREIGVVQKLTDTEALKIIDDQLQKGPRRGKTEEADADDAEDGEEGGIGEAA